MNTLLFGNSLELIPSIALTLIIFSLALQMFFFLAEYLCSSHKLIGVVLVGIALYDVWGKHIGL